MEARNGPRRRPRGGVAVAVRQRPVIDRRQMPDVTAVGWSRGALRAASWGHGPRRQPRRRTHRAIPGAGADRLAVDRPARWHAPHRPDLVLVGRRGLLVFSKPDAQKVRNMRENHRGHARRRRPGRGLRHRPARGSSRDPGWPCRRDDAPGASRQNMPTGWPLIGLGAGEYAATYSLVIRIVPDQYLGWHGRNTPQSARVAGAPAASLDEPRHRSAAPHGVAR